jgi:hypothetical protein
MALQQHRNIQQHSGQTQTIVLRLRLPARHGLSKTPGMARCQTRLISPASHMTQGSFQGLGHMGRHLGLSCIRLQAQQFPTQMHAIQSLRQGLLHLRRLRL